MQKHLHQNKDNHFTKESLNKTWVEKGANLPLTMTDYIFLFGFFLVVFWAVDPFEWRLAYRGFIKHFPVVVISPAFFLTIAGVYLSPKRNKLTAVHSDNKVAIILLSVFATFVTLGSLYARFVKGIDNGFLTMGLYTLTAPLTVWFVRKSQNPFSVIKWMVLIYFIWSLVAVAMQIGHIGQAGYFHEREHLVISVLILMFYIVNNNVIRFVSIIFIIAAALVARKNTAYMIMLMALAYIALVWAIQHAQKIKDKFSKWAFWLRNGLLGFALAITAIGVYFSVKSALPDGNPDYRLHTYEIAWNKFLSSPIWGTGFTGAATEKFDLFTVSSVTQTLPTHSDPLDILAQGGLIGFIIWLAILLILLKQWFYLVLKPQQQLSIRVIPYLHTLYFLVFSGYFVCTFNPLLNNPSLAWTFWGAVGALFAVMRTESKKISTNLLKENTNMPLKRYLVFVLCFGLFVTNATAKEVNLTPDNYKKTWGTIQPGDKVIFADGEYRVEFYLNDSKAWSAERPTTFTAQTVGKVIIKGSDLVKDWYKAQDGLYTKDWPTEAEQVFVNGKPLKQLGGTIFSGFPTNTQSKYHQLHKENGGIWPGRVKYEPSTAMPKESFYYDASLKKLIINTQLILESSQVEVSVRRRPFFAERVSGIVLDGLVFEHSNASYWDRGALMSILGNDIIVQNVKVRYADATGISIVGDRNKLLNSEITYSGQLGIGMRGKNNEIKNVIASYNNTRGFNKWWEAGGFKFVGNGGLQSSKVVNNVAVGNNGDGIWFDWQNKHNLIKGNVAAYNTGFGVHYELSQFAVIQDNKVYGNGQRGIYLRDSANCEINNNVVIANGLEGIVAVYTGQKDSKGLEFGAENVKINANIVGWNNGALIMPKGASAIGVADKNIYLGNQKTNKYSLGYPSAISRAANSLKDWQTSSGFDKNSAEGDFLMPNIISESILKHELIQDWSAIHKLADQAKKAIEVTIN